MATVYLSPFLFRGSPIRTKKEAIKDRLPYFFHTSAAVYVDERS